MSRLPSIFWDLKENIHKHSTYTAAIKRKVLEPSQLDPDNATVYHSQNCWLAAPSLEKGVMMKHPPQHQMLLILQLLHCAIINYCFIRVNLVLYYTYIHSWLTGHEQVWTSKLMEAVPLHGFLAWRISSNVKDSFSFKYIQYTLKRYSQLLLSSKSTSHYKSSTRKEKQ